MRKKCEKPEERAQKAEILAGIKEANAGKFASPEKVKAFFRKWKAIKS